MSEPSPTTFKAIHADIKQTFGPKPRLLLAACSVVVASIVIVIAVLEHASPTRQLQLWRTLILSGSRKLVVTGASTTANGGFMYFDGDVFIPESASDAVQQDPFAHMNGIFKVHVSMNQRGRLKRMWQPHRREFFVGMTNGSAYMWTSAISHTRGEYFVSESCVSRDQVPSYAQAISMALLTPDPKRFDDLDVRFADKARNHSEGDTISIAFRKKDTFDVWQVSHRNTAEKQDFNRGCFNATWMVSGGSASGNVVLRLQLVGDDDASVISNKPLMLLAGRERAFRKCQLLMNPESG